MWKVVAAKKQLKRLAKLPETVKLLFAALENDLRLDGPEQPGWRNYSKLGGNKHHCHLNYSYVACWTADKGSITIEVYYVGSREGAPY